MQGLKRTKILNKCLTFNDIFSINIEKSVETDLILSKRENFKVIVRHGED